MALPVIASGI